MAAIEKELWEQFKRLNTEQKQQVLSFVHRLAQPEGTEETWTEEEIDEMLTPKRMTPAEVVAWLDANPPPQPWGDLKEDEDPAEYIHRSRHSAQV